MLLAFNKPYGVLSQFTSDGSPNRPLAEFDFPKYVYPIGRLDADSEGLLLLSDEPEWNARLLEPRHAHEREYWVQVERIPTAAALCELSRGVVIQGRKTLPCRAWMLEPQPIVSPAVPSPATNSPSERERFNSPRTAAICFPKPTPNPPEEGNCNRASAVLLPSSEGLGVGRFMASGIPQIPPRDPPIRFRKSVPDCWIGLELIEGKNRQVRRMTAAIGHPTLRLLRVRIGRLVLGELPAGKWKALTPAERQLVSGQG